MVKSLVGRLVDRAQFHVGFGNEAKTGLSRKVNGAHMEVTPPGIYVEIKGKEFLVPYSNVVWCELLKEEEAKAKTA